MRPSFDGFSLARRLDSNDDRGYNKRPRASRGRDDDNRGRTASKREREAVTSSSRPRDRSVSRRGPSSGDSSSNSDALDWIKLDHEKLTKRAQALAKTRNQAQVQAQIQDAPSDNSCQPKVQVLTGSEQSQTVPNGQHLSEPLSNPVKKELPPFSPLTSRSNQSGSIQLTPSTLNLSSISLNNSVAGEAMETDEAENELLGIDPNSTSNNDEN